MSQVARATRFVEGCGSDRPQLMRAVVMFHLRERHHVEQLVSQIARLAPTRDRRYYGAVNRLPQDLVKDIMSSRSSPSAPCSRPRSSRHRDRLAGARHRRQRGHLLLLQPDAARVAGRAGAGEPGQPRRARAQAGLADRATRPATATKSSATRCSATCRRCRPSFTGIAAHRLFGANLSYRGADDERPGPARLRQLLPGARRCSPRSAACLDSNDDRLVGEVAGRRAEPRVLDDAGSRADPDVAEQDAHRQRPDADDRRRRAARASTGRRSGASRRCSCRSRCAARWSPGFQRLGQPADLLGLPVRAAAGRASTIETGARGAERASITRSSTTSRRRCRRA